MLPTIPKLTAKAQKVFNGYIRKRDSQDGYFICISCGRTLTTDQMDAGHFAPVKGGSALRFDEYNVNGECKKCNGFDEFHLIGYRRGIIEKYGEGVLLHLEQNARLIKKWSRTELNELIEKYGESKQ
jgi:5-methylcytosine-specific restriction endonuclease McrA